MPTTRTSSTSCASSSASTPARPSCGTAWTSPSPACARCAPRWSPSSASSRRPTSTSPRLGRRASPFTGTAMRRHRRAMRGAQALAALRRRPSPLPMRGERFIASAATAGPVREELVLEPGDALYIPRGVMYDAVAAETGSRCMSPWFHSVRWSEVLIEAIAAAALEDPALRRGVDLGALVGAATPSLDETLRGQCRPRAPACALGPSCESASAQSTAESTPRGLRRAAPEHHHHRRPRHALARRIGPYLGFIDVDDAVPPSRYRQHHDGPRTRALRWRPRCAASASRCESSETRSTRRVTLARRLIAEGALRFDATRP